MYIDLPRNKKKGGKEIQGRIICSFKSVKEDDDTTSIDIVYYHGNQERRQKGVIYDESCKWSQTMYLCVCTQFYVYSRTICVIKSNNIQHDTHL